MKYETSLNIFGGIAEQNTHYHVNVTARSSQCLSRKWMRSIRKVHACIFNRCVIKKTSVCKSDKYPLLAHYG